MEIEVRLYASLRRYRPKTAGGALHHPFHITLPEGATIATIISELSVPPGLVTAAILNKDTVELDAPLKAGDIVRMFPPTAGG